MRTGLYLSVATLIGQLALQVPHCTHVRTIWKNFSSIILGYPKSSPSILATFPTSADTTSLVARDLEAYYSRFLAIRSCLSSDALAPSWYLRPFKTCLSPQAEPVCAASHRFVLEFCEEKFMIGMHQSSSELKFLHKARISRSQKVESLLKSLVACLARNAIFYIMISLLSRGSSSTRDRSRTP